MLGNTDWLHFFYQENTIVSVCANFPQWKETCYAFLSFSVSHSSSCKRSWKSAPTDTPLSHRKHCPWNVSPLTLCLSDITLCHRVTNLHIFCLTASLACKNWLSAAALLSSAVLGQACVSWPVRGERVIRRGALKRQELKQSVSDRGGI